MQGVNYIFMGLKFLKSGDNMKKFLTDHFICDAHNREFLIKDQIKSHIRSKMAVNINISVFSKSVCERNIHMIKFGNVKRDSTLYVGSFHGLEWLTSLVLIRFASTLTKNICDHKKIKGIDIVSFLNKYGLVIIPCLNPDGVEISLKGCKAAGKYSKLVQKVSHGNCSTWQANARGVDLNHNFPANWPQLRQMEIENGIKGPASTRFGGLKPLSEPETYNLTMLCKKYQFRQVFAFHSQGEEIYWDFCDKAPAKSKLLANVLSASSGYAISKPKGLAVGGGFKDWFILTFGRPGFTIEMGKGKNPLPVTDLDKVYKTLEEMLLLGFVL